MHTPVRDGIALRYVLRVGTCRPIVLVHGWCCDHAYFAPQLEHFSQNCSTVGSGHFCQLEVPEQANAMLDRFLEVLPSLEAEL